MHESFHILPSLRLDSVFSKNEIEPPDSTLNRGIEGVEVRA